MDYVYASATTILAHEGEKVRIYEGEVWAGSDPVVLANPSLFSAKPTKLRRTTPEAPVETATAAPGEKRSTRKPKGGFGAL